ncbi:methionine adenosyltransferase [Tenericutes bacterium MZ-XQ]|jgi:S-adenosylmethionine synthetase|nr:methionine adenosyltransferase [Tenericutes bacterium MZ-XQ]
MYKLFSSESVTEGHPDKLSDYISDSILDACLEQDPESRVAIETAVTTHYCLLFGEITTKAKVDYKQIVKQAILDVGYTKEAYGYSVDTVEIDLKIKEQSADIALGVNKNENKSLGAGDQGLMFGYANSDTDTFLPLPIYLAHRLAERLSYVRKTNIVEGLRPDGKTQVTVAYDKNHQIDYIHTVVLSTQHDEFWTQEELHKAMLEHVIKPVLKDYDTSKTIYKINPTGRFIIGGPHGDAGLTGRKIIVDTYGGYARHGGGAFSGKDATKVDRSAAYMARYIAKNIVASGVATECEIQLAYAIGVSEPVSVAINTFDTEKVDLDKIYEAVLNHFDLTPKGIIKTLKLNRPIYKKTAAYGHFGRNIEDFSWESLDKIEIFKKLL